MDNVGLTAESYLVSPLISPLIPPLIPPQNSNMIISAQPELYLPTNQPSLIGVNSSENRTLEDLSTPTLSPEETSPKLPLTRQFFSRTSSVAINEDTLLGNNTITGSPESEDTLTQSVLSLTQSTPIDFNTVNFSSYAQQDEQGLYQIQDEGNTVELSGNTWQKIRFSYRVTSNTVLKFDFSSPAQGELQGIGFDKDNSQSNGNLAFMLNGIQSNTVLNKDFHNYAGNEWKTYTINLGQYAQERFNYLLLINDNDQNKENLVATSYFRNVRLYESQDIPVPPQGETPQAIPVWHSGFENGFPGDEWSSYHHGNYSPVNQNVPGEKSAWTIIDSSQAAAEGVSVLEGDHIYKGWIDRKTASKSHRAYPVLPIERINPEYPDGIPSPIVNRFYVWADWQTDNIADWMHFLTVGNSKRWDAVTMSAKGPDKRLELTHAGSLNQFEQGNGWERINDAYMPLREWVRFTVYLDFRPDHRMMYVWMDGQPIFRANGKNLKPDAPEDTTNLLRAHWGLYSRGSLDNGVQYNDSIQLWGLTQPLTDFSQEPISPYDGTGKSYESTLEQ